MADLGLFHVLAILDRHECLVGTLDTIGDDYLATGCIRRKAVLICGVDMLESIFATSYIQRVAIGKEGLAAQLLDDIGHGARIIGAQKTQVSQLAEVDLDGDELVLKIDLVDSRAIDQALELIELALAAMGAQVSEIDLGGIGCHSCPSLFVGVRMQAIYAWYPCSRIELPAFDALKADYPLQMPREPLAA